MEASGPQSISLHSHGSNITAEKTPSSSGNEQWSLINGLPKEKAEAWASLGSPRTSRGKLMAQASPKTSNALRSIYSPPSCSIPMTSEGIVVQALNVVADQSATHISSHKEASLKKVSKRRRKTNGGVDVEHSKSNNEFLRKLQHSLRDSQEESEGEIPQSPEYDHNPKANRSQRGMMSVRDSSHSEGDEELSATSRTTSSTGSDSFHRGTSHRITNCQTRPKADADESFYGYEDPDKVMPPIQVRREPRVARRRNSVTEHTIRAAQKAAAFAAAEQAQRKNSSHTYIGSTGHTASALAAAAAQRLQNLQGSSAHSPLSRHRRSLERPTSRLLSRRMSAPEKPHDSGVSSNTNESNPYGYGIIGMPMGDKKQQSETPSNPFGYGDPDAGSKKSSWNLYGNEHPNTCRNSPYGYGDFAPQRSPRSRLRPQRRGSVTKYSLNAAKNVAAANKNTNQAMSARTETEEYTPVIPANNTASPARSLSPKTEMRAPAQPTRKASPWQTTQGQQSSDLRSRKPILARNSKNLPVGPPVVHVPRAKKECRYKSNDSSDDDDDDNSTSSSDDRSKDDSVASITVPLKDVDEDRDAPMRPPSRRDSLQSFASRGSTHSACSIESDGDSLAPDMRSLCSISQHERHSGGSSSYAAPPPPGYLPHTPTPRSQSRKTPHAVSLQGLSGPSWGSDEGAPDAYVDTSPLASPKTKEHFFHSGPSSLEGQLIIQPDLPIDTAAPTEG